MIDRKEIQGRQGFPEFVSPAGLASCSIWRCSGKGEEQKGQGQGLAPGWCRASLQLFSLVLDAPLGNAPAAVLGIAAALQTAPAMESFAVPLQQDQTNPPHPHTERQDAPLRGHFASVRLYCAPQHEDIRWHHTPCHLPREDIHQPRSSLVWKCENPPL